MKENVHILGFAGSLRRASHNRGLLRAALELLPDGMSLEIFDLSAIPLYNADIEAQGFPKAVEEFRARIAAADALLIAAPEYNQSIPGVLKNAIDWASRSPEPPLDNKPMAMMGAGGVMGSARSQNHLRQVAASVNLLALNKPALYAQRSWEKFDPQGNLIDEETRQQVRRLLEALAGWTRRLQK